MIHNTWGHYFDPPSGKSPKIPNDVTRIAEIFPPVNAFSKSKLSGSEWDDILAPGRFSEPIFSRRWSDKPLRELAVDFLNLHLANPDQWSFQQVQWMNDRKHVGSIWGVREYKTTRLTKDYMAKLYATIRRKEYAWNDLGQSNRSDSDALNR